MSDVAEERKKSASTISDAEIIDAPNTDDELTDNESVSSLGSRKSSVNNKVDENVLQESEELIDPILPKPNELHVPTPVMSDEEYEAIYTPETRARAIVLLLYFSILLVVVPFSSMYFCYYHIFYGYDSSTAMLYSGIVAIVEVYVLVAIFVWLAYKDEQSIERKVKAELKKSE
uniref:Uncharacterized protein n=1 Tax=Panagrolaimus sp. JU765 TaxID=591449 RepID=A0AC34Q5S9_9BILA